MYNRSYYSEALSIRNKLLLWRLNNWNKINPDECLNIELGDIEPRLKQTAYSIIVVIIQFPEVLKKFLTFLAQYQNTLIEERATSFDGQIVNIFLDIRQEKEKITSQDIAELLGDIKKAGSVGRRLKALGLKTTPKKVDKKTQRIIICDTDTIERLKRRYVPSETSVTSVTTVTAQTEVTPVTTVTADTDRTHLTKEAVLSKITTEPRPFEDICTTFTNAGHTTEEVTTIIQALKKDGSIYEPVSNHYATPIVILTN